MGLKTELLDRRVRLIGALFWSNIKSPQVLTTINTGTASDVSLTNAQNARIRGVEASVDAVAAKGLTVHGAVPYLEAKYTKFIHTPIVSRGFTTGPIIPAQVLGHGTGHRMAHVHHRRVTFGTKQGKT